MFEDELIPFGLTYNVHHAHSMIYNGGERGKMGDGDFDELIVGECMAGTLTDILDMLTPSEVEMRSKRILLPNDMIQECHKVAGYYRRHGPSMPLAIGMMFALRDKHELGMRSPRVYASWREALRSRPARDFHDFVTIAQNFEREMKL